MTEEKSPERPEDLIAGSAKEEEKVTLPLGEVQQLQELAREFKDKYLRGLAESENARKRMQKEKQELTKYAIEGVITEFLNPLDNFEKALRFAEKMSDEVKNWAVGFEMILAQFKQILTNHGISELESVGKPFDPHWHEAVEVVETNEYPPGYVVHEFVRGYKMGDRPIRVARVKVSKAAGLPEENKNTKD